MNQPLEVFKALGDNTRYAIYLELARSPVPRSTGEIADTLGLHPNTVRPHLDRMRDVGLLQVTVEGRGNVGRPQHRYSLAADAPSLGLEPSAFRLLAAMLVDVAAIAELPPAMVATAAQPAGAAAAEERGAGPKSCLAALTAELAALGFDPAVGEDANVATVAFTHCPFRDLAEMHPEVVCNLHRGLVEGFVARAGGATVTDFATLEDRDPCRVDLALR
ncbi:MAG: helix-turn-helix transcriptional regulator [Acidimicrobiia bacterium]